MVHQLSTILDDLRSSIHKQYKPICTNLNVNKNHPKSCSPQSNINSSHQGSCASSSKKPRYNKDDHGIEASNIIFNISDEDDYDNMTSKIPSVHPSDSFYYTQKQHMSDLKCTTSTICTPVKQMKNVPPKHTSSRTRQGVLTHSSRLNNLLLS